MAFRAPADIVPHVTDALLAPLAQPPTVTLDMLVRLSNKPMHLCCGGCMTDAAWLRLGRARRCSAALAVASR